jgi:hypothetical protein
MGMLRQGPMLHLGVKELDDDDRQDGGQFICRHVTFSAFQFMNPADVARRRCSASAITPPPVSSSLIRPAHRQTTLTSTVASNVRECASASRLQQPTNLSSAGCFDRTSTCGY